MALQKKKYRCSGNRSRGGVKGKRIDTSAVASGNTPKDYGRQCRSFHGSNLDKATDALHKQIVRRAKYG